MSGEDRQGGAGRREVAWRLFAAEYDDATLQYSEADEERAPNYVVTPTGARVNRLFVVGVLTEVERVTDEVIRARIVDPTGAFVVYAGQYQPDAVAYLEDADPPEYVALTGKARTYQPDDSDRVFTSVRPESITPVDAETRDRWTVQAAALTVDRIDTMAATLDVADRGEAVTQALLDAGVDYGLAAGIPLAVEHYGTTPAYLASLRGLAIDAARLVAGEVEEVEPLAVSPGDGGSVETNLVADPDIQAALAELGDSETAVGETDAPSARTPSADTTGTSEAEEPPTADAAMESTESEEAGESAEVDVAEDAPEGEFELDEEERDRIEAEYGTEFSTGTEVDDPGEADIETPGNADGDADADAPAVEDDAEETGDPAEPVTDSESDEPPADAAATAAGDGDDTAPDEEPDLEEAVVTAMREADEGDGVDREAVVDAVTAAHDVDVEAVEDAIQSALMSGKCYEPADGRLKAI